jgi:hypothetical protein
MTDRTPSLLELRETDQLLDELGARRTPIAGDDPVVALLGAFAEVVDAEPMREVVVPPAPATRPRSMSRSRHLAAVLAVGITLSTSGIAAAVTGDPLLPIKTVVKNVYDIGNRQSPESDWILGSKNNGDPGLPGLLSVPRDSTHANTDGTSRSTVRRHVAADGSTPVSVKVRDGHPGTTSGKPSSGPDADPSSVDDSTDQPGTTTEDPGTPAVDDPGTDDSTDPGDDTTGDDTTGNDNTGGTHTNQGHQPPVDKPHHANNGNDSPGKPSSPPGKPTKPDDGDQDGTQGTTNTAGSCTTDTAEDQAGQVKCPKPKPTHPTPKPGKPQATLPTGLSLDEGQPVVLELTD